MNVKFVSDCQVYWLSRWFLCGKGMCVQREDFRPLQYKLHSSVKDTAFFFLPFRIQCNVFYQCPLLRFVHHLVQTTVVHLVNLQHRRHQGCPLLSNRILAWSLTYHTLTPKSYLSRLLPAKNRASSRALTIALATVANQKSSRRRKLTKPPHSPLQR